MFRVRLEKWDVIRNGTGFLVPLQRDRTEWGIYPGGTGPDILRYYFGYQKLLKEIFVCRI